MEFKTPPKFIEYADAKQLERGRLNGFSYGLGRNQRQVPVTGVGQSTSKIETTGQIGSTDIGKGSNPDSIKTKIKPHSTRCIDKLIELNSATEIIFDKR